MPHPIENQSRMTRRQTQNLTGLPRLLGEGIHDAWIAYVCIGCRHLNTFQLGERLLDAGNAFDTQKWECAKCNLEHKSNAALPFPNWPKAFKKSNSIQAVRFWQGFFRIATEHPESYWKWCNVCDRILPFSAFSKHANWGPLQRQMECRSCKGSINAVLNPLRTAEQLREGARRRRAGDLLLVGKNQKVNVDDLFRRFNNKCFKTGEVLTKENRKSWSIDHILPSAYLYPLSKQNAALLSSDANNAKGVQWPSAFYTNQQLVELSMITGVDLELIASKKPVFNSEIDVNACVDRSLTVREGSDLVKRVKELKWLLKKYGLATSLSVKNRKILGL